MTDETTRIRRLPTRFASGADRRLTPVRTPSHALELLGSVWLGRVVFTGDGLLPTIRPVDHILVDGCVVVRTDSDTALARTLRQAGPKGVVVAYEADDIDLTTHTGWSVIVTGRAHLVTDPDQLRRYRAILHSAAQSPMDLAVRIHPLIVTGYRLDGMLESPQIV